MMMVFVWLVLAMMVEQLKVMTIVVMVKVVVVVLME
jgi:hypothetical protein